MVSYNCGLVISLPSLGVHTSGERRHQPGELLSVKVQGCIPDRNRPSHLR